MPRFFFHLFDDIISHDEEGVELADAASALALGAANARHMAAQSVLEGHLILDHRIEVEDSDGKIVGTIHFRDVVEVRGTD